ncbi:hypothetical protein IK7_06221 [Bacillus cereus VD156]|uniref:AP2 domain-containing protein n=1 Tax=Bacillus cereus TaxID=1396 RepID=UPI000279C3DD|nr:AP2 domain-containing protein [Bacillus cereus]EJR71449.1 hypothetical protein IK7_06221 [Bacillus cereus VD156]
MVKEIPLQNDMLAIVDDEDYERCMDCMWLMRNEGIVSNSEGFALRRFILKISNHDCVILHKNNNKLDFRKENLSIGTLLQSKHKARGHKNTSSKYKGVSFDKRREKWISVITNNGKTMYLGRYDNEDDAALAYNKAAIEMFGGHAYQNVIGKDNCAIAIDIPHKQPRRKNKIGFRGVSKSNKKYTARIIFKRQHIYLGVFGTSEEAARAYDKKAIELFGDKAVLNFPEEVS